jgi:folate-binding protein YgfZ
MSDREEAYRGFQAHGGIADLSGRLKLRLVGSDRVRYLNGQVTANVQRLEIGHALAACVTTAKGKLSAEVVLHATSEALYIDADPLLRETLPDRLARYIIADDVEVEDVTESFHLIHLTGEIAPASDLADSAVYADRHRRYGRAGWDLLLDDSAFQASWPELTSRLVQLGPVLQETLRIEAGIPRWGAELNADTLPPEAGLDRTHIDYHKGCYIGQEVISRLKSVGHVNRELTGFVAVENASIEAGMAIFAPDNPDKPIGLLTSTTFSFALEKQIALGYLRRGAAFPELLARSAGGTGAAIRIVPHHLPFLS